MRYPTATLLAAGFLALASPTMAAQAIDPGARESLRQTGQAFAAVAQAVSPSVVFLQVEGTAPQRASPFGPGLPFSEDFLRRFFGEEAPEMPQQRERRMVGQGSGFVFRSDDGTAYIITNNHVVQHGERIRVRFEDGREFDAEITGTDPQSDIAIIEVAVADVPALELAETTLNVGEWVVAIGSPFGLRSTLTVGVVSATGRTALGINDYEDFIQTDAAINPGNSGGPLVNLDGQVVGMNTAIFSRTGGYMGIGFAIPVDLARAVAVQLIEQGEVIRGFLGVAIQPLTPDLAESFGIDRHQGILVAQVTGGSPAGEAGIQVGDVIVGYQGRPVEDVGDFRNQVALTEPGTRAQLTVLRDGEERQLAPTIASQEGTAMAQAPQATARQLGVVVQTPTPQMAESLGVPPGEGVVVTQVAPQSPAAEAGLTPGTVILQVNRQPVTSPEEFSQAIEASAVDRAMLLIRSGDEQRYVVIDW
ncbi:MAG: Do family serine endopeptidase [Pseudomonadales bacterium]